MFIAIALLCTWMEQSWCQRIDMAAVEAEELFRTGVRTFHRGSYQSAILSLERSLALRPEAPLVLDWLASANYRAGYVQAAIRTWRDLTTTSYDTSAIKSRLQYATYRYGLGAELSAEPRWVLAYQIRSRRGETNAFQRPVSVRALRDGTLAVTSLAGNHLSLLDVNGSVLQTLRGGLYGFDKPFDVLEVPDGFIVSEFGGRRIVRCTRAGQRRFIYGTGKEAPRLLGPQFLALDSRGYLYVTDWGANKVHKYDSSGAYLLSFGATLQEPTGIAIAGDEIYVAERKAGRVSVFDESGNLLRTLGEGRLAAPEGLAFWDEGTLLVADGTLVLAGAVSRDTWSEWSDLGAVAKRLTSVSVDAGGAVYVSDMDADAIHVLTRQPNLIVGNNVWIGRISGDNYPEVTMEVAVMDRYGRPLTGLTRANFQLYEAGAAVPAFSLARTPVEPAELDVVVIVDQSPDVSAYLDRLRTSLLALHDELAGSSRLSFVAGEVPTVLVPAGTSRLRAVDALLKAPPSSRWALDTALRVAVNELSPSWGKKAVVYLTAGGAGRRAFEATSLAESAAMLANNAVSFSVVTIGDRQLAGELSYLARNTGGRVLGASSPRGVAGLSAELGGAIWPLYLLRFTSGSFPDYGRRYLPVRVEVVLPGTSGGDVSGYFAPVER